MLETRGQPIDINGRFFCGDRESLYLPASESNFSDRAAVCSKSPAGGMLSALLFLMLFGGHVALHGQNPSRNDEPLGLHKISEDVRLDGTCDEAFWREVDPLPLTMQVPAFRGELTERTEILIAYDEDYFYVCGRMYDSEPDGIRVNTMYRDWLTGDDHFGILIDRFNDNENALWFFTTPAAVRGDVSFSADGQTRNGNWNTYWDAAASLTERGWFAEMRIPFSSLGFQGTGDNVAMGISAYRFIARKNEWQVYPEIPPELGFFRPSLTHDAVLEGIQTHNPVYVTPYLLGGVGQRAELNAAEDRYNFNTEGEYEIGGDVKYNVTSNLTLDLTANTDFAQVEADFQQVNLTRFSLFFPERRQFFQERSGMFGFYTGGATRLFHSRRIGLRNDGTPIRILGGTRLVGRVGDWDLGFLDMQTARYEDLPSENFGVLRVRRRVFNQLSNAGAMLTTRIGEDGGYNVAYGLDGFFRYSGDHYFTVQWAQSLDDEILDTEGFKFAESGLLRVTAGRFNDRGFSYFVSGRRSGSDYRPDMGFVTRQDFTDFFGSIQYFHYPEGDGPFRRLDPFQLFGSIALRNQDRSVESAYIEHDFDLQWRSGASLGLDLELYYEDLRADLNFPEASVIPSGSYTFFRHEGDYNMARGTPLRTSFGWGLAQFYDGWRANIWISPQWNVSRHLGLNAQYQLDRIRFPDRDQGFDAHIARLWIQAAVNAKLSVNAFCQFSSVADFAAANVRLRYNFREGNDLWIVYNEGLNLDRDRMDPVLLRTDNRTVLLKYTHTFAR